jgi:hypothetical protein
MGNEERMGRVVGGAQNVLPDGLWQFEFAEVTGHNLEARGRKVVNQLLEAGWRLLHIYTLRYEENGIWRDRPMAILGRPKLISPIACAARSLQPTATAKKKRIASPLVSLEVASPRGGEKHESVFPENRDVDPVTCYGDAHH